MILMGVYLFIFCQDLCKTKSIGNIQPVMLTRQLQGEGGHRAANFAK